MATITLTPNERVTLVSFDGSGKGPRRWLKVREVAGLAFKKNTEDVSTGEQRAVRNALRRLLKEELLDFHPSERGKYRITEKGRKVVVLGEFVFPGMHERGRSQDAVYKAASVRSQRPRKTPEVQREAAKKAARKQSTKKKARATKEAKAKATKATKKKAAAKKKAPTRPSGGKRPLRRPPKRAIRKIDVVDKTKETDQKPAEETSSGNGEGRRFPRFRRREAGNDPVFSR